MSKISGLRLHKVCEVKRRHDEEGVNKDELDVLCGMGGLSKQQSSNNHIAISEGKRDSKQKNN